MCSVLRGRVCGPCEGVTVRDGDVLCGRNPGIAGTSTQTAREKTFQSFFEKMTILLFVCVSALFWYLVGCTVNRCKELLKLRQRIYSHVRVREKCVFRNPANGMGVCVCGWLPYKVL